MSKPLAGKRVVITRALEQSAETAVRLRELGATPIIFPAIQFIPLDSAKKRLTAALNDIRQYDWILFTSQNGVRFFDQLLWELFARYDGLSFGAPPKIAAVGQKTARLLKEKGFRVDLVPDAFVGERLIEALGDVRGQRILLPRAKKGRPEIVEMLKERGAMVDEIALYDTVSADPTPEALTELNKGVDAILFTSPSTVKGYLSQVGERPVSNFVVGCIGEVTRRSAEAHNVTVNIVPEESTMDGLILALIEYYKTHE